MRPPHDAPHRVLIVGGGFGGLAAARALRRAPVAVTLVDRANHHLFQPLLDQVSAGLLTEGEIAPPLRGCADRPTPACCWPTSRRSTSTPARSARQRPAASPSSSATTR